MDQRTDDQGEILARMTMAIREALIEHKRLGHWIAIDRDGEVVRIPPEEIPELPTEEELEAIRASARRPHAS